MNSHLNDEQLTEWLLGTNDDEAAQHLATCNACRTEGESLRNAIAGYCESAYRAAERDEAFWAKQRLAIRSRVRSQRFVPYVRWAAAAVMILVAFAAFMLTRSPQPAQQAKNELSDDAVLQQVENSLDRNYPTALAPAVLIDQERSRALSSTSAAPGTPAARAGGASTTSKQKEQQQ
ncbi:MAG: hypothetical protein ABSD88_14405 [Candidatus Korobacteraceae bacterium]|jgi:hypothetical protein